MPIDYGYGRVSHKDQNEARQLIALAEVGIPKNRMFIDKRSGKDFNRPQYQRLLKRLRPGDTVFTMSIDRLGRNYAEILEQWRVVTKEKRADIVVLDMPLLDTRQREKDLTGAFVADLVLAILSYCAETERRNIKKRQAEGIAAARARGVRFGRPAIPVDETFRETVRRWRARELKEREALALLNISRSTFYKKVKDHAL